MQLTNIESRLKSIVRNYLLGSGFNIELTDYMGAARERVCNAQGMDASAPATHTAFHNQLANITFQEFKYGTPGSDLYDPMIEAVVETFEVSDFDWEYLAAQAYGALGFATLTDYLADPNQ